MSVPQSILDRIHKLNTLANAAGTEAEAANAAERVRELLFKYNLELGEVALSQQEAHEAEGEQAAKRRPVHSQVLFTAVQKLCGVGGYYSRHRGKMTPVFYGAQSNVDAAVAAYQYLKASVERIYEHGKERTEQTVSQPNLFFRLVEVKPNRDYERRSFLIGCSSRILERINAQSVTPSESMAIMRITDSIVQRHFEKLSPGFKLQETNVSMEEQSFQAGHRAGANVDLHGAHKQLK